MELHQLEQFVAISRSSSMHEAAERLYLSQSTLSYNLKKLETELGCRLFDRTRAGLKLTSYGEILLRHADRIAADCKELLGELDEERRRDADRIHLGCFSLLFASFEMPQIASELPDRAFEVFVASEAELAEGLGDGRFDAVITTQRPSGKGIRFRRLYEEQAYLSVPRESPLAEKDSIGPEELGDLRFNIESGLLGCSEWYQRILSEAHVPTSQIDLMPFKDHLKVKDALPTCNLITSFIMEYVRVNEARSVVPINAAVARRTIGIAYREDRRGKLRQLLDYLDGNLGRLLSGHTFIPYFLFPEDAENLTVKS